MIVLFRDSSVNYWLNNSVVDCGNVDAPNSNPEIVFPHDDDYEMIAKQIKENDENEKKIYNIRPSKGYKKKYNNISIIDRYHLHNKEQLLMNKYNCENIIIDFEKSNYDIDFLMKFIKEITFVINVDIFHSEKQGLIIHNYNYDTISKSISRKLKIFSLIEM